MADKAVAIHPRTSREVYRDDSSPRHPVKKGTITLIERFIVDGTDPRTGIPSGDALVITLYGAKSILFAHAQTPAGTVIALTESGTAPNLVLTSAATTTDVQLMVVYTV